MGNTGCACVKLIVVLSFPGLRLSRVHQCRSSASGKHPLWEVSPRGDAPMGEDIPRFYTRMEFAYDGGGLAKGGTVTLYLDGDQVGEGRVEATVPLIFSADETADVGRDTASPVSDDYEGESSVFTGTVNWVQIDLGEDAEDADHLITPEERLRVAMARQ